MAAWSDHRCKYWILGTETDSNRTNPRVLVAGRKTAQNGRGSTSRTLDAADQPRVAYGDQRYVNYATRSAGEWISTTVLESLDEPYNGFVVLRLDPQDRPAIAFWQHLPQQVGVVRLVAQIPEPATLIGALIGVVGCLCVRVRRQERKEKIRPDPHELRS